MGERHPPGRRADYLAFQPLQTRWHDNDAYGHMNNAVYYALFDTAISNWLIANGLLDVATSPAYGVVVESGCRFHSEIAYPDAVTAGLRLGHLGTSSVRFEVALFAGDSDVAAAEGFFTQVQVARETHRPVPLTDAERALLSALLPR